MTKLLSQTSADVTIILPLILLFLVFMPMTLQAELIDRVVAEVNDDVITLSEINEEGASFIRKIIIEAPAEERDRALQSAYRDILDGLIDKLLISQEAARQGIVVTQEEVDTAVKRIITGSGKTEEEFFAEIESKGLDRENYLGSIKSQIYQNKLVTRDIRSKIVITEEMILDYYDTKYTRRVEEGGYYLLQIGITWDDADGELDDVALQLKKRETLQKVERVHKLARSGKDFKELARKFSDLPSAADGGDIGVFDESDMASYMQEVVVPLEPGMVSAVVESPVGFQFFKLLSNREGGIVMQAPYDTVKEDIREELFTRAMQDAFVKWIDDIREKSYIKKLL